MSAMSAPTNHPQALHLLWNGPLGQTIFEIPKSLTASISYNAFGDFLAALLIKFDMMFQANLYKVTCRVM